MSALSLSALAEASYPYGIEAFDPVLQPLWKNCRKLRGKSLAAILKVNLRLSVGNWIYNSTNGTRICISLHKGCYTNIN